MKRIALIALCLFVVTGSAWAQKKNVTGAAIELNKSKPDFEKAREYLEAAATNPSTIDYPKTWYLMGKMYIQMHFTPDYKGQGLYKKAADASFKLIELDPKYEKNDVDNIFINAANMYYNESVKQYNNKDYAGAIASAERFIEIRNIDNGKRFSGLKSFDTTAAAAKQILGLAAFYNDDKAKAKTALEELINDPIYSQKAAYSMLYNIYMENDEKDKAIAVIDKGRAKHPNDKKLRINEINFYIITDQQDIFVKKLEDAVAVDPNNAELQFFLAKSYAELANPEKGDKPANHEELMSKAEAAYKKAVELDPENITYNFDFGAFYFNQAGPLNDIMKDLGTTPDENKKYDELNNEVKALYSKAMPYLQKTYDILGAKSDSLNAEDKSTFINSIIAIREIHARRGDTDKSKALKEELDQLRSK